MATVLTHVSGNAHACRRQLGSGMPNRREDASGHAFMSVVQLDGPPAAWLRLNGSCSAMHGMVILHISISVILFAEHCFSVVLHPVRSARGASSKYIENRNGSHHLRPRNQHLANRCPLSHPTSRHLPAISYISSWLPLAAFAQSLSHAVLQELSRYLLCAGACALALVGHKGTASPALAPQPHHLWQPSTCSSKYVA